MTTFLFVDLLHHAGAKPKIEQTEGPLSPLKPVKAVTDGDESLANSLVQGSDHDKISMYLGVSGAFVHGFIATLSFILVSELGDKTFFIGELFRIYNTFLKIVIE